MRRGLWRRAYDARRARSYEKFIRIGAGPVYRFFMDTVVETLRMLGDRRRLRILDLGAGTGNVTRSLLNAMPSCSSLCLDGSSDMLRVARGRFPGDGRVQFEERDFSRPGWTRRLGRFDAVVSVGAIHHLDARQKKSLFRQAFRLLVPGGTFLCGDPLRGSSRSLHSLYETAWVRLIRRNLKRIAKKTVPLSRIRETHRRIQRGEGDQPSPLDDQLQWLREAGFKDVDCHWKYFGFAVYGGTRPA